MVTEERVLQWMRKRLESGHYDTAAALAREFLNEHQIRDVLDPDFVCVMEAGFKLAPEIAQLDKPDPSCADSQG